MLINGNCLEKMKDIPDKSVDLIFCDLPYGQTSCKWDCKIDLEQFWKQVMRIKILNAPIIMTTTTKFGVSLIQSAPKKCPFRYDLIWCKSASCGFLSAKKMPLRKHEMIYVFYEKLPFYDLSSHKHKFIKERNTKQKNGKIYEGEENNKKIMEGKYDPPLPNTLISITKDESIESKDGAYGGVNIKPPVTAGSRYDPPLPDSLIKETDINSCGNNVDKNIIEGATYNTKDRKTPIIRSNLKYDPPLPNSLIKETDINASGNNNSNKNSEIYGKIEDNGYYNLRKKGETTAYDPPLPNSLIKETAESESIYGGAHSGETNADNVYRKKGRKNGEPIYEPPLPDSLLEIKSTRGKHSTEKPVDLMKWILKYYSREGSCVLDPTMGSGSMGVACEDMNRNFIGIEMDKDIYDVAVNRINNKK